MMHVRPGWKGRKVVYPSSSTRAILAPIVNVPSEFQARQPRADQWTERKGRRINETGRGEANAEVISKRRRPEEGKGGSKSQSRSARLMLDNADAAYRRSIKEDGGEQRRDGSRSGATIEKENYCESYLGSTRIPSGRRRSESHRADQLIRRTLGD